ncbi:hypothetical protein AQ490_05095 [Wenjunlia vitaminophila]|uniref:Uncharacterized protein n=1 Tax=Wenjunlia vitaminophila TaxID=76728 RepID=A0A0T6LNS1_WENVI|nr:hypothetical protein [Wenjunlia vitaminophila]KRV47755.1 hypothetical protein AQ490_05095 [Wenjunlia vitaminophila]
MAGFLDRAKESATRALNEGRHKVDEVQEKRAGQDLLRKLGAAYYAQQQGHGSPQAVQDALNAVEEFARTHGDTHLRP